MAFLPNFVLGLSHDTTPTHMLLYRPQNFNCAGCFSFVTGHSIHKMLWSASG